MTFFVEIPTKSVVGVRKKVLTFFVKKIVREKHVLTCFATKERRTKKSWTDVKKLGAHGTFICAEPMAWMACLLAYLRAATKFILSYERGTLPLFPFKLSGCRTIYLL